MTKDMKYDIHRFIILFTMMCTAIGVKAQNANKLYTEDALCNHLSVGLSTGLTGTGIDVVMPVHKIVTIRAGFSGWDIGNIKFKAINTATEITQKQMVEADAVKRSQMVDKVELAVKPNFWNIYIMGEVQEPAFLFLRRSVCWQPKLHTFQQYQRRCTWLPLRSQSKSGGL